MEQPPRKKMLKLFASIIHEFLEFCFENAECSLYPENFNGKETKIINDFIEKRRKEMEDDGTT